MQARDVSTGTAWSPIILARAPAVHGGILLGLTILRWSARQSSTCSLCSRAVGVTEVTQKLH